MSEGTQNAQQQTQEDQYLQEAQDFFAQSMGRIKGRMQSDSAQLEGMMQQLPEESQAQVQEMTDSYSQFEGVMDQAAQDAGVQDSMDEAAQQARQTADEATGQGQEAAEQAADQVQEMAGRCRRPGPGCRRTGQPSGQVRLPIRLRMWPVRRPTRLVR